MNKAIYQKIIKIMQKKTAKNMLLLVNMKHRSERDDKCFVVDDLTYAYEDCNEE